MFEPEPPEPPTMHGGVGSDPDSMLERLRWVKRVFRHSDDPVDVPFGLRFGPLDGPSLQEAWRTVVADAVRGEVRRDVFVYVHVPYCIGKCTYCMHTSQKRTSAGELARYADALVREIEAWAPVLAPVAISGISIGGGTPGLLAVGDLDRVLAALRASFRAGPRFRMVVEMHPQTTTRAKLDVLRRHGVGRVSFGVQTFTPEVLEGVNRGYQRAPRVRAAIQAARDAGIPLINVDLLAGLPGETTESFVDSVRQALDLRPDSLSVNRFLAENSPLAADGFGTDPEDVARVDRMLMAADSAIRDLRPPQTPERPLDAAGYGAQYDWPPPGVPASHDLNDMTGPSSTLGLGSGAMGHLHGRYYTMAAGTPGDYADALLRGDLPGCVAAPVDSRFEGAYLVAEGIGTGTLTDADYRAVIGRSLEADFGPELRFLTASGLVARRGDQYWKPRTEGFQTVHLFAFLLRRRDELQAQVEALAAARRPRPKGLPQYDLIGEEMPMCMLWNRICLHAIYANRRLTVRASGPA